MAFLGGLFGGGEEEQQAAPQKGFFARMFGGIGDFLGSLVKIALIAVATITGLGLLMRNDTAKGFFDEYTGGKDKGAGTWISNMFEGGLKATKKFFGMQSDDTTTPPPAVRAYETKDLGNGKSETVINGDFLKIVKEAKNDKGKNSDTYEDLKAMKKTREDLSPWNPLLTDEAKALKEKNLNEKQMVILTAGQFIESSNKIREATDPKDPTRPPEIPLNLPALPAELNQIGVGKYNPETWGRMSQTEQLAELHKYFNDNVNIKNAPDFKKSSLNGDLIDSMFLAGSGDNASAHLNKFDALAAPGLIGLLGSRGKVIKGASTLLMAPLVTTVWDGTGDVVQPWLSDAYREFQLKKEIFRNLDQGSIEAAIALTKKGKTYFEEASKDIDRLNDPDKFKRYTNVNDDFKKITEYLELAHKRQTFDVYMSQANGIILSAVDAAPVIIEKHQKGLSSSASGTVPPAPPTASEQGSDAPAAPSPSGSSNTPSTTPVAGSAGNKEEKARAEALQAIERAADEAKKCPPIPAIIEKKENRGTGAGK